MQRNPHKLFVNLLYCTSNGQRDCAGGNTPGSCFGVLSEGGSRYGNLTGDGCKCTRCGIVSVIYVFCLCYSFVGYCYGVEYGVKIIGYGNVIGCNRRCRAAVIDCKGVGELAVFRYRGG